MAGNGDAHGQTQNVEAFVRKLHERIGAWLTGHWTQILSAVAGVLVGAGAVFSVFTSQVRDANAAAADAKQAAIALTSTVAQLRGTVDQLVTQQQLQAALERITRLEEDYHVAYQQAGTPPVPGAHKRK